MKDILPVISREVKSSVRQAWNKAPDYAHLLTQATTPAPVGSVMRGGEFLVTNPTVANFVTGLVLVELGTYLVKEVRRMIFERPALRSGS